MTHGQANTTGEQTNDPGKGTSGVRRPVRRMVGGTVAAAAPLLMLAPTADAQGSADVPLPNPQQIQHDVHEQVVTAVLNALGGMPSIPGIGRPADIAANIAAGSGGVPVSVPGGTGGGQSTDPAAMSREVFDATNNYRTQRGLRPLAWNQHAADVASAHAAHLSRVGGVAHNQGALDQGMGENIAASSDPCDAACFVRLWENSPGHKINLEDPAYRGLGVGVAVNNGRVWVVQDFTY
jgi:uncharacterized protein YkwD